MASKDQAVKGTDNTGLLWILVYFIAAALFLESVIHTWYAFYVRPFSWENPIDFCFKLLLMPIPLVISLIFRRTLKDELGKEFISERTYRICDYMLAQLLLFTYICLV